MAGIRRIQLAFVESEHKEVAEFLDSLKTVTNTNNNSDAISSLARQKDKVFRAIK